MSADDILSQDEIDALLRSADRGEFNQVAQSGGARTFDLASRRHLRRESLPGLERLNQRFAEQFRASLSRLLGQATEVVPQTVQYTSFGAYQHSLFIPSSLTIVRLNGLGGGAMIMADARLVFRLVDRLFGGSGRSGGGEGRDFSVAENRLIERFSNLLIEDLNNAWSPVLALDCQLIGREVNPVMAVIAGSSDGVLVNRFAVDSEGTGGEFHLVVPAATLDPIRDKLQRPDLLDRATSADPQWRQALSSAVLDTPVATSVLLAEKEISLRALAQLQVGDVIKLGVRDSSLLKAAGVPVFRGQLGIVDQRLALKLGESLLQPGRR